MKKKTNRKAQEEIVGFVLIVLIVSVILLVFLGIFLRKDRENTADPEVTQFLDALFEITTECSLNNGYSYEKYSNLIEACNEGLTCNNGDAYACDILKKTTKEAIENSWIFSSESEKKGYIAEVFFVAENSNTPQQLPGSPYSYIAGGVSVSHIGDERVISVSDGSITMTLDLYLN